MARTAASTLMLRSVTSTVPAGAPTPTVPTVRPTQTTLLRSVLPATLVENTLLPVPLPLRAVPPATSSRLSAQLSWSRQQRSMDGRLSMEDDFRWTGGLETR